MEVGPLGATPTRTTPREDSPIEERGGDTSPMEEVSEGNSLMQKVAEGASLGEANETATTKEGSGDQPENNVVERQIGRRIFKLGRLLSQEEQDAVAAVIARHLDVFAWSASDMPGIDPDFLCHHLTMDAKVCPIRYRRRKLNKERRLVVKEETQKLLSVGHIREIQYPEWLANVVLVKKANGKWRMCVDFIDLNKACPKDSYPLPNIDALVDSASSCKMLSFLDAFSGYNLILPVDQNVEACLVKLGSTCAPRQPPSFATIHLKNLQKNRAGPLRPIALQRPSQWPNHQILRVTLKNSQGTVNQFSLRILKNSQA